MPTPFVIAILGRVVVWWKEAVELIVEEYESEFSRWHKLASSGGGSEGEGIWFWFLKLFQMLVKCYSYITNCKMVDRSSCAMTSGSRWSILGLSWIHNVKQRHYSFKIIMLQNVEFLKTLEVLGERLANPWLTSATRRSVSWGSWEWIHSLLRGRGGRWL